MKAKDTTLGRGEIRVEIANAIAQLRTAEQLSQKEFADRLFVSRELVSKWELGERRPDYATIERIAGLFGVPIERLIDRNDLLFRELEGCIPKGATLPAKGLPALLDRFLETLSPRDANLFLNRYYYMKKAPEIAKKYGLKENHVRSILSKTRKKLKKAVKEGKL